MLADQNPVFDHLLHYVPDVAAAAQAYTAAGLPAHAGPAGVIAGFQNGAWALDQRYVEILNISDPEAFAASPFGAAMPALQDSWVRARDAGGGALTFAIDVTDAAAVAARLKATGHQVLEVPVQIDGVPVGFTEVFLLEGPSWLPFFITYSDRDKLAELMEGRIDRGDFDLGQLVIEVPDPSAAARWLGDLLGIEPHKNKIALPGLALAFKDGPADAITEVIVTGRTPLDVTLDGLRYLRRE